MNNSQSLVMTDFFNPVHVPAIGLDIIDVPSSIHASNRLLKAAMTDGR